MDAQQLLSVAEELAEVTRLLAADDVAATMSRYVDRIVRTVPGCEGALISAPGRGRVDTLAGTWQPQGSAPADIGPIGEALRYGEPRRLPDVRSDDRWPKFSAELDDAGFRSALVLPLTSPREDPAALTLLAAKPDEFGDASFDVVQLFAVHAGTALDNATLYSDCRDLVDQLRTSLRTRALIGQAQGLLMAADDADTDRGFALLRDASQRHNVKLRVLAEELVRAHETGEFAAVAERYGLPTPG